MKIITQYLFSCLMVMNILGQLLSQNEPIKVLQRNGETIQLSYDQNDITLEYTGIYLHNSHKIQYQYFMEGVHEDWVQVGTERIA